MQTWLQVLAAVGASTWVQTSVWAQSTGGPGSGIARAEYQPRDLVNSIISVVLFGLLGIVLAIVGFKMFDAVVKFDFEREICEKQNIAVAILCGFMVLGICLIIAATVTS
jgi:uncharacterized membrane protein YjfL (UPF0719 family)